MFRSLLLIPASLLIIDASAVQVNASVQPARCGLNNGTAWATATGGLPPYSYSWSNGPTGQSNPNLAPGEYIVTVTDGLSNTDQDTVVVEAVWELSSSWIETRYDCNNWCSGRAQVDGNNLLGTAPYTWPTDPNVMVNGNIADIFGLCGTQAYPFTVSDANGCAVTMQITVSSGWATTHNVVNITPECIGEGTGSITMDGGSWWWGFGAYNVTSADGGGYDSLHLVDQVPFTISDLAGGSYWVEPMVDDGWGNYTWPYCEFGPGAEIIVPGIQPPCGSISGRLFNDVDADCAQDPLDIGLPYRVLTIEPGPQYAISNLSGDYYSAVPTGSFTISQPLIEEDQRCPALIPAPFTVDLLNPNVVLNFADSSLVQHDLVVSLWQTSAAMPGFTHRVRGHVHNVSAYPSGTVDVVMNYDPILTPTTISPPPSSVVAGTITWSLGQFTAYQHRDFEIRFSVPADIGLLGYELNYAMAETNSATESNDLNNAAQLAVTITGSYDPNDKLARTSSNLSTSSYFLDEDQYIDYTIRFQNTGTAFAQTVVVKDSLEFDLEPTSLQIFGATHAFTPSFENGRTLVFTFANINLPDSGFNEPNSHGSIHFRIKPRSDITVGETITNAAAIYFDFNPPVITELSELFVELSTSVQEPGSVNLHVYPVPADDVLRIACDEPLLQLEVLALDGRLLMRQPGPSASIAIGDLAPGSYFLRATSSDGQALVRFQKR